MPTNLAPVYLDDARVQLQGDPKPRVSTIVAAGGKAADGDLVVVRLRSQGDAQGSPMQLEDVIDRAKQTEPVYLRCIPGNDTEAGFAADESTGVGGTVIQTSPQFGAARRGIAGQGAKDSPGDVPADKQAKSDAPSAADLDERSGGSRPARGNPDSTQEFQSGGRQGEGLPASHPSQQPPSTRRQASRRAQASEGNEGGDLRDQSTDHAGRQQGQRPSRSREGDGPVTSEDAD